MSDDALMQAYADRFDQVLNGWTAGFQRNAERDCKLIDRELQRRGYEKE